MEDASSVYPHFGANNRAAALVFAGRGWGHGVGMCQVGAYGLAKQGFSSEQILQAYYTGIELTKMYLAVCGNGSGCTGCARTRGRKFKKQEPPNSAGCAFSGPLAKQITCDLRLD